MRSAEAELDRLAIATLDPQHRIAELEQENASLRRLLARTADDTALAQLERDYVSR